MSDQPTLIWSERAIDDLENLTGYIALTNWSAAVAMQDKIEAKAKLIPYNPRAYRVGRMPDTREMVVHSNYLVIYRENAASVTILRVLHAAQCWP